LEDLGEPPSFTILERDGMRVMIKQIADHDYIVPHWTVSDGLWDMYFWVDDVGLFLRPPPENLWVI
jgi:hypothetical protein